MRPIDRKCGVRPVLTCTLLMSQLIAVAAHAVDFQAPVIDEPEALSAAMPALARAVETEFRNVDRRAYLDTLFRLQLAAGDDEDAIKSLTELRNLNPSNLSPRPGAALFIYEILARARLAAHRDGSALDKVLGPLLRQTVAALDDPTADLVLSGLSGGLSGVSVDLHERLDQQKGKSTISLADALKLVRAYQAEAAVRNLAPFVPAIAAENDQRRYIIDKDVAIRTPDGGIICAVVVRPREAAGRFPALLQFTIYANADQNLSDARQSAAHGYAGVVGLTRGKGCSPGMPVPYVGDGADADALIEWISTQPWSDGRVGIYGGSYSGWTAWAAAKRPPKALKAIMVGAPAAPGIDAPMEGNVVWSFVYPWPFYTTGNKWLDDTTYNDSARWNRLTHDWYVSGRPYRDLENIDGTPNPVFDAWISHPTYDAYWQAATPYKEEFARIDIPVLQTAGYFAGGPGAAVYYMSQHYKYNPHAQNYLVIGPYDHFGAQRGTFSILRAPTTIVAGYELDPAAQIDLYVDLRFKWFDYVLRGGPKPDILQDKVNYQVTGANTWKHAPSLAAMSARTLKFYLSSTRSSGAYKLDKARPSRGASTVLSVNFADRSDADTPVPGGGLFDTAIDTSNGLVFISDPLAATELSGLFSGRLDVVTNKKDFDFQATLYEQTVKGEYFLLAPYWSRASHVGDIVNRRLLTPGKRQRLDFQSVRLMSHQVRPGSRIVAVLNVIKNSGQQINYGTGKDVSEESIADAKEPLTINLFADSYIAVPIGR
ncbi:MAG: CocE/NonD family hydrolase [Pseudomonadota bacterium]|nr:CocE/NonD family hydrolase [Pseudomonadota bacterium]